MKQFWPRLRYPLVLLLVIGLSLGLFGALYRWDNKYRPQPQAAQNGVLRLDMVAYEESPLLFLVDGWEYYHQQFLSPDEAATQAPDALTYLGQYAGFDRGDKTASPHGQGTWRLTILCDGEAREYALEVPEIYSAYRLWINGTLKKSEGFTAEGDYTPQTSHSMVTFTAEDKIEIVIAARDETHFYSGMVYPPAFGSTQEVLRLVSLRLLLHAAACGIALAIALLSLFFGFRNGKSAFRILALLCAAFIACAGYPLVHMLGLRGSAWYDLECMGYYAVLFATCWLAGRLCRTTPWLMRSVMALAGGVVLSVPLYRHLVLPGVQTAASLYTYSGLLGWWKWLTALYLLATVGHAVWRGHTYAKALLAGICVLATALVADRLFPWYEPIVGGWFGEVAAGILVLVVMGVLCADAMQTYRENRALQARAGLDDLRLESYRQQEALQAVYVEQSRKLTHDVKSMLLTMQHHLHQGNTGAVRQQIDSHLGQLAAVKPQQITPHRLLNTILSQFSAQATAQNVAVEYQVEIPAALAIEDEDLSRLCLNILDNALEACLRLPPSAMRRIRFAARFLNGVLEIHCQNTYGGTIRQSGGHLQSQKADTALHGYGTRIIEDIARRLGSGARFSWDENTFTVVVRLNLGFGDSLSFM